VAGESKRQSRRWFDADLADSKALWALSGSSAAVYIRFLVKRHMESTGKGKKAKWHCTNNGNLRFTYKEAKSFGVGTYAFTRTLTQLVEVGLLDITRPGGGIKGDCALYALSERWRLYGKPGFVKAERKKGRQSQAQRSPDGRFERAATESENTEPRAASLCGTTRPQKGRAEPAPTRGEDS